MITAAELARMYEDGSVNGLMFFEAMLPLIDESNVGVLFAVLPERTRREFVGSLTRGDLDLIEPADAGTVERVHRAIRAYLAGAPEARAWATPEFIAGSR